MCCTKEELTKLNTDDLSLCPTHIAPSYTIHPRTGDDYSAYNKPLAVIDWLARNDIKEEYILIIDADMIMRKPFLPIASGAAPGWAVSAFFGYMKGVSNQLALKHIPEVIPHNDTLAGPAGRRGDQVGGFTMMYTEDLKRMSPLWLKYTEDVRFDPDAWELSGDQYSIHPGDKPWISEMYGYSYGASKAGVWHRVSTSAMLYPAYRAWESPMVLHYGLMFEVAGTNYSFDKHWHEHFDVLECPPWDIDSQKPSRGIFPHAPSPLSFVTIGFDLLTDLLAVEVPITLNAAFCERHLKRCSPSEQLTTECNRAFQLEGELKEALDALYPTLPDGCVNGDDRCQTWADAGECDQNPFFMKTNCRVSCKECTPNDHNLIKTNVKDEKEELKRSRLMIGQKSSAENSKGEMMGTVAPEVSKEGMVLWLLLVVIATFYMPQIRKRVVLLRFNEKSKLRKL